MWMKLHTWFHVEHPCVAAFVVNDEEILIYIINIAYIFTPSNKLKLITNFYNFQHFK